jgi:outer membrane biosynthesis protein TonB
MVVFTSDDLVVVDPAEKTSDRIYSQADPQVTVPVSVYPKLPNEAPGTRAGRTILELTIAADGLVERVKMLTAPRNIHEFMLVSAAKAWRFEPARLDGRPVRFRQMLALTPMP